MPSLVTPQCARLRERRCGSALDSCCTDASPTRKFCGNTCLCIEQRASNVQSRGSGHMRDAVTLETGRHLLSQTAKEQRSEAVYAGRTPQMYGQERYKYTLWVSAANCHTSTAHMVRWKNYLVRIFCWCC